MGKILKLIQSDHYRISGKKLTIYEIITEFIYSGGKGVSFVSLLRMVKSSNRFVRLLAKCMKRHYSRKFCIDIGSNIQIGKGFYIGHGICIVIHGNTVIGDNVNISQFVNIGSNDNRFAVIGNNVYIGPHVCIVGGVHIGDNASIGAGAVVTKDVPENATVVGVPAKVINYNNPGRYIINPFEEDI